MEILGNADKKILKDTPQEDVSFSELVQKILNCEPKKPYSTLEGLPTSQITDMHIHTAGIGKGSDCFISDTMQKSWKYDIYLKAFGVSKKDIEDEGDGVVMRKISEKIAESHYVGSGIILAMDGVCNEKGELDKEKTEVYISNEFVKNEVAKYKNLYYGASINPQRKDAIERLEQAKKDGAKLIKWLGSVQLFDPSDTKFIPFYKKMVDLNMPFLTHVGKEKSFTIANDEYTQPEKLELPLELGVNIIAAHVGVGGKIGGIQSHIRTINMIQKYPNLYADIAALTNINKIPYLKDIIGNPALEGKLLYGTDAPLINMPLMSPWHHISRLSFKEISLLSQIQNVWDRDVLLKQRLGVPKAVFELPGKFFSIPGPKI